MVGSDGQGGHSLAVTHIISARGQTLSVDVPTIVQHGLNSDVIELDLDGTWEGLSPVLTLGDGDGAWSAVYEGPVSVPSALMEDVGYLPVTVTGYGGSVRMLSATASHLLRVVPSGYYDGTGGVDDGEDLLGQLVGAYEAATEAAGAANEAAQAANEAAEAATEAIEGAGAAVSAANEAADAANEAAQAASEAALAAGERSLYAYADPEAEDRIVLEYPAFLESDDGCSVYLTLEGED